jgi:aspartate aminotransferase-like enzyme
MLHSLAKRFVSEMRLRSPSICKVHQSAYEVLIPDGSAELDQSNNIECLRSLQDNVLKNSNGGFGIVIRIVVTCQ